MKIAVITDIHANLLALNAVLEDIAAQKPDQVICAGDMVGTSAYPDAPQVWQTLQERGIPCVLGNEEARIINFHGPEPDACWRDSVQFRPLQYRARQFSSDDVAALSELPITILVEGPHHQNVLICHASPGSLHRSPFDGIDPSMAQALQSVPASVIVVGHYHTRWHYHLQDQFIIMAGSVGLPFRGLLGQAEYLLLTCHGQTWDYEYRTVPYDHPAALARVLNSTFIEQGGPIGWLMLDEALTQQDRLSPFLDDYCPPDRPDDLAGWQRLVMDYLIRLKRWEVVKPYLQPGV